MFNVGIIYAITGLRDFADDLHQDAEHTTDALRTAAASLKLTEPTL